MNKVVKKIDNYIDGTKDIAPIGDEDYEMEYLTKSGSKARVIEKGFNSMTIELI